MSDAEIARVAPSSMVEIVARAVDPYAFEAWRRMYDHCIASGDNEQTALKYADMSYLPTIERAKAAARAAIEAMMTPTPEMVEAVGSMPLLCRRDCSVGKIRARVIWETMLASALEG